MEAWLTQLVGLLPGPLRGAAQAIVDRLLSIWHAATDFWTQVRYAWQVLRVAGQTLIGAQLRHLYSLAVTIRWIVQLYVPRVVAGWVNAARDEARQLVNDAINGARIELAAARAWLAARIDDAQNLLAAWARWTFANVSQLLDDASRLKDRVFGTWATPERLAAWAIGAIITAAIAWFEDNAVALGQRLVAQRTQIFLSGLDKAEDIVSRIL